MAPISREQFFRRTSVKDRALLRQELCLAILYFIEQKKPVYLEGLGIVFAKESTQLATHPFNDSQIVREEKVRSLGFEKCYDLVSYYQERFSGVVDAKDLAGKIYPRLPLAMQVKFTERETRWLVARLVKSIRDEITVDGSSTQLSPLGTFYSLHNRQGQDLEDWFAGSSVFLDSSYSECLAVGSSRIFEQPTLGNAFELIEAALGKPLKVFSIDLAAELGALGYDAVEFCKNTSENDRTLKVAVFSETPAGEEPANSRRFLYCTDGLRKLAGRAGDSTEIIGNELVVRVDAPLECDEDELDCWPSRALTMGWILINSAQSRTVRAGSGLGSDGAVKTPIGADLGTIFVSSFSLFPQTQRTLRERFRYMSVVGITSDEAKVAEVYSPAHLQALLRFKGYDQVTKISRSSIIGRSGLLSQNSSAKGTVHSPADIADEASKNSSRFKYARASDSVVDNLSTA